MVSSEVDRQGGLMGGTRRKEETKAEFLKRILVNGSHKAKVLKCADRISNMISLGFVTSCELYIGSGRTSLFDI